MHLKLSTKLKTTTNEIWRKIENPSSLIFVSEPILYFEFYKDTEKNETWKTNYPYKIRLKLFNFIELGEHTIIIKQIDVKNNRIISCENGKMAKVWNHTIEFKQCGKKSVKYTDKLNIKAGILTPLIWCFAIIFYLHRQQKWKKLITEV